MEMCEREAEPGGPGSEASNMPPEPPTAASAIAIHDDVDVDRDPGDPDLDERGPGVDGERGEFPSLYPVTLLAYPPGWSVSRGEG